MSAEKDKEALAGSEEETAALKAGDVSTDIPEMDDSTLDNDCSRARFISNTNSHAKGDCSLPEVFVDVEGKTKIQESFVGLSKEELMKFAEDPKWKKIRLGFLISFWVGWVAMLVAAIVIIVLAPKCPPRPKLEWWQTSTVYQVCPKSFKDSNADGVGDLNGIHSKLDYLTGRPESINISAVVLNSIYPHGGTSSDGSDITDFINISPEYGSMEDFENMRIAMHKKGLKLILDFIPNHSSSEHDWFLESRKKSVDFTDFYVWKASPPNNWRTLDGSSSAWTLDSERREYYLASFGSDKPDLNLRNEKVREQLANVLKFWLEKGVDGFRVNFAQYLFECANFTNDEACRMFQPESYEIIADWREQLDEFAKIDEKPKYLMVQSSGTMNQTLSFYEHNGRPGAHAPINSQLLSLYDGCDAQCVLEKIASWINPAASISLWNNWQLGNWDTSRVSSRYNEDIELVNLVNMMALTLPGTAMTYYGEEIGMHNSTADGKEQFRSPMQWTSGYMAGFTESNSSSLVVPADSTKINVQSQLAHGAGISSLEVYAELSKIRSEPSFQWGNFEAGIIGNILFYVRQAQGFPGFLVAMNFGPDQTTADFVNNAPKDLIIPNVASVVANTGNFERSNGDFDVRKEIDLSNLLLHNKQGVIFQWKVDPNEYNK